MQDESTEGAHPLGDPAPANSGHPVLDINYAPPPESALRLKSSLRSLFPHLQAASMETDGEHPSPFTSSQTSVTTNSPASSGGPSTGPSSGNAGKLKSMKRWRTIGTMLKSSQASFDMPEAPKSTDSGALVPCFDDEIDEASRRMQRLRSPSKPSFPLQRSSSLPEYSLAPLSRQLIQGQGQLFLANSNTFISSSELAQAKVLQRNNNSFYKSEYFFPSAPSEAATSAEAAAAAAVSAEADEPDGKRAT